MNSVKQYPATETVAVNGIILHYAVAGEGAPVILLHGNGEDHTIFSVETEQLVAAGYKVFAPDTRGHGANAPLPEYHYADMAEDIYGFIRTLDLTRPVIFGHSDGGITALLLEIRHPGTVGALAASGANLSPQGLSPSFLAECAAVNEKHPDPLTTLMLEEPRIDPEDLKGIRIPVLVTAGEHDLVLRTETAKIAAAIPDAEMTVVKGADHGSYIVGSEIMGNLLLDFLKRRM